MTGLWHSLGFGGIGLMIGASIGPVFRWFYPDRKAWTAERQAKLEKEIDRRVMQALENRELWKGPRPTTGSGDKAVRADELAEALSLKDEEVSDSLERLESRGRIDNARGNFMDPTPRWRSTRRL